MEGEPGRGQEGSQKGLQNAEEPEHRASDLNLRQTSSQTEPLIKSGRSSGKPEAAIGRVSAKVALLSEKSLSCFSLIITGECNFDCSYCYQEKDGLSLDPGVAARALDFLIPFFARDCAILFCGGEPLLRADVIREAVLLAAEKGRKSGKNLSYAISTNGSLLDENILNFLDRFKFTVLLSFDGSAQEACRKPGSYRTVSAALDRLLARPAIELHTNSVFTPETVDHLSSSIRDIVGRGVPDVQISFSTHIRWGREAVARLEEELSRLRGFLLPFVQRTGRVPVTNFRRPAQSGIFGCRAGETRMALSPDGRLWGCHHFYDFHKKMKDPSSARFCFGDLDSFVAHSERSTARTLPHYADLRVDYFHTPSRFCGQCKDVYDCVICPVDAALSSGIIGRIVSDDCRIRRVFREQRRRLWEDLEAPGRELDSSGRRESRRQVHS